MVLGLGIQIYIFSCVNPNTMSKLLFATLITAVVLTSTQHLSPTYAGTCASKCGSPPLQFTPGKHIRLEVINSTPKLIKLEKIRGTNAITLQPGQKLQLDQGDGQGAGGRGQGAGSRGQGAGSRGQGAGSRGQGAGSRGQGELALQKPR
jgi:hypothetical protein